MVVGMFDDTGARRDVAASFFMVSGLRLTARTLRVRSCAVSWPVLPTTPCAQTVGTPTAAGGSGQDSAASGGPRQATGHFPGTSPRVGTTTRWGRPPPLQQWRWLMSPKQTAATWYAIALLQNSGEWKLSMELWYQCMVLEGHWSWAMTPDARSRGKLWQDGTTPLQRFCQEDGESNWLRGAKGLVADILMPSWSGCGSRGVAVTYPGEACDGNTDGSRVAVATWIRPM